MSTTPPPPEGLTDSLAEGIAAVMAATADLDAAHDDGDADMAEELTDLFLFELNRLWSEPDQPEAAA